MLRLDTGLLDHVIGASLMLSEDNSEASRILQMCIVRKQWWLLMHLDDMNIRGEQIVIAYNKWCLEDHLIFEVAISRRDQEMLDFINKKSNSEWLVVRNGGSAKSGRIKKENHNVIQFKAIVS